MFDIKSYSTFKKIKPVNKGWSSDKKYYIETMESEKLLLRTTDISAYDTKKHEFEMMKRIAEYDISMSHPIEFGICDNGKSVYSLLKWCDGEDAEIVLPKLANIEQYALGMKSGQILRKIHSIPAQNEQEHWATRFNRKTDNKIRKYNQCGIKIDGDNNIIDYIEANRYLLEERPQCFQHGDYHVGNMVISSEGELSIIDFNRNDYGDPWEEFNRIVWSAAASPYFATGQLNGYFNGRPPVQFFRLLAFYISSNTLSSIYWAISFGADQISVMKEQAAEVLTWFDGMNNPIPTWYLEDFCVS